MGHMINRYLLTPLLLGLVRLSGRIDPQVVYQVQVRDRNGLMREVGRQGTIEYTREPEPTEGVAP